MKAVVQRVSQAKITVEDTLVSSVGKGLLVYLGACENDTETDMAYITRKLAKLRIFPDDQGKMNRCITDTEGEVLLVSQFTLCADTRKGNRPSFNGAMEPEQARLMLVEVGRQLEAYKIPVKTGIFGAHMMVEYVNDGPVTIILDSGDTH
ncbi:MAG: D-aminoacyl-tRNA deacylase [Spirochaetota bacterium]